LHFPGLELPATPAAASFNVCAPGDPRRAVATLLPQTAITFSRRSAGPDLPNVSFLTRRRCFKMLTPSLLSFA
jgi:hypothetical protein